MRIASDCTARPFKEELVRPGYSATLQRPNACMWQHNQCTHLLRELFELVMNREFQMLACDHTWVQLARSDGAHGEVEPGRSLNARDFKATTASLERCPLRGETSKKRNFKMLWHFMKRERANAIDMFNKRASTAQARLGDWT